MSGILGVIASGGVGSIGGTVGTPDLNPSDFQVNATAQCGVTLNTSGGYVSTTDLSGDYCTPTSLASGLEARLVFNSGDNEVSGSALNTWLPLTTERQWTLAASPGFTLQAICTLSIRETLSLIERDTSTVTFSAQSLLI
jgi:hypothetical protein